MRTLKNYENKSRGTPEFPCKLYRVDKEHSEFVMPFHWHSEYEIIFVRSGELELSVDDHTCKLKSGDIAFLSDGALHGGNPADDSCVYYCIVFSGELMSKNTSHSDIKAIFKHGKGVRTFLPRDSFARAGICAERLCECMTSSVSDADGIIATGILLEFFGEIIKNGGCEERYSESGRHITRLKTVISYIDEHYSEKITLDELARAAGVSPKYLCRTFFSLTGKTPISYLNEYRIECACDMLRSGEDSMPEIAAACGFGDQSYFVKQFHRIMGVTPGAFKRMLS